MPTPDWISTPVSDALMRAAVATLARLPHGVVLRAARWAADVACALGLRRETIRSNLDLVYGEARTGSDKRRIARSATRNLFLTAIESLRVMHPRARDEMASLVRLEPAALVEDLAADPRPLLLAVAHSGNFDLAGLAFARQTGRSLAVVMKHTSSRTGTRLLVQGREALGYHVFGTWDRAVLRHAIRHLRGGGALCMLPDQYAKSLGVVVPFMGQLASTHSGPAFTALKAPGTRVVVAVDVRQDDGARHLCQLEEIEGFTASGDTRADVADLTLRINDAMSRLLEKAPESYLWQHRRWRVPRRLREQLRETPGMHPGRLRKRRKRQMRGRPHADRASSGAEPER